MARRQRYRGRGKLRRALTVILALTGVLLVLGVVLFTALPNYLVYTADGGVYLDIPFLNRWREATDSPKPEGSPSSETRTPSPEPSQTPDPTPSPTPKSELPIHALYVPINVLKDESALTQLGEQLSRSGADALVLEFKAEDGFLAYSSSLPLAMQAQVSSDSDAAVDFIRKCNADGIYVVARIACFKNTALSEVHITASIKTQGGSNWLENTNVRWLDPYKQEACDYLLGLLSEVAGFGVDEILLDWVTFPTSGRQSAISFGAFTDVPRYEAIEAFVKKTGDAVASSGVTISMVLNEETCLNGTDEIGGQRLSALSPMVDRFYVPVPLSDETGSAFELLTNGLVPNLSQSVWPAKLVPMLSVENETDADTLQTALDAAGGQLGLGWLLENDQAVYPALAESFKRH